MAIGRLPTFVTAATSPTREIRAGVPSSNHRQRHPAAVVRVHARAGQDVDPAASASVEARARKPDSREHVGWWNRFTNDAAEVSLGGVVRGLPWSAGPAACAFGRGIVLSRPRSHRGKAARRRTSRFSRWTRPDLAIPTVSPETTEIAVGGALRKVRGFRVTFVPLER